MIAIAIAIGIAIGIGIRLLVELEGCLKKWFGLTYFQQQKELITETNGLFIAK